jgi:apolipoprotein N-acyltransferase
MLPFLVPILYGLFYACAFPPIGAFETAFLFAIPHLLWSFKRPTWKGYLIGAYLSSWAAWAFLLAWLRHVPEAAGMEGALILGWLLVLVISSLLAFFNTFWLAGVRWLMPRIQYRPLSDRVLGMLALAAFWVVLEWVRTWFLFGFPWLPLSASQWRNPVILQIAAYTGAYGVSFLLIIFNAGIGFYAWKILTTRKGKRWYHRLCPEFYVALGALMLAIVLYVQSIPPSGQVVPSFKAGVVQPDIPQTYKGEPGAARENLEVLQRETIFVNALEPDVLLWPESSTPNPVIGEYNLRGWIEELVRYLDTPLLMGNLSEEEEDRWYNGIFGVSPESGLVSTYYKKRRLVPFGEYVPFRSVLPFDKFVPLEADFYPGEEPTILPLDINGKTWQVGGLVCYEDIFPGLARSLTREGAEFFFVATNNGWYGQEGAAYQHATHPVLRAVENGRPILRCGNDGWSGYIDERGHRRDIFTNQQNSIYTRGGKVMQVYRNREYSRTFTVYSRLGDWFVWVCMALVAGAGFFLRKEVGPPVEPTDPDEVPQVGITRRKVVREDS